MKIQLKHMIILLFKTYSLSLLVQEKDE